MRAATTAAVLSELLLPAAEEKSVEALRQKIHETIVEGIENNDDTHLISEKVRAHIGEDSREPIEAEITSVEKSALEVISSLEDNLEAADECETNIVVEVEPETEENTKARIS